MKAIKAFLLLLALGLSVYGQGVVVTANKLKGSATAPSGTCKAQEVQLTTAGVIWTCQSGTWGSAGGSSGLTIGTTTITSGTTTRVLYNNAGVLGEYTITGTAGSVVMSAGPTLTGTLGAQAATFGDAVSLTSTTAANNKLTQGAAINIGTTSTDGIILQNTTAAAAGAQQRSPRLRWTGQGWKTDATAASQTVDWIAEVLPVQAAANPTSSLIFSSQINGGGYTDALVLNSNRSVRMGGASGTLFTPNSGGTGRLGVSDGTNSFLYLGENSTGVAVQSLYFSTNPGGASNTGLVRVSDGVIRLSNASTGAGSLLVGTSTDSQTGKLTVLDSNAATNSVVDIARLGVNSTGTAATGLGARLSWGLETSTTNDQTATAITGLWADATHASRTGELLFLTVSNAGSLTERARVTDKGFLMTAVAFASLGTPANGTITYCNDCTVTSGADNTATSGGTGALVVRLNGVWRAFVAQN